MNSFVEKRKFKRTPIDLNLEVSKLYKQNNDTIKNIEADITVVDISKSGLGFTSKANLPVGYYFDSTIGLGGKEFIRAVVKIVRMANGDNGNRYGAEFVGLAPFLQKKVDDYQLRLETK